MIQIPLCHAGNRIDFADAVNLVTEEFNTDGTPRPIGRVNFQGVTPHPEFIAGEINVVTLITNFRQLL